MLTLGCCSRIRRQPLLARKAACRYYFIFRKEAFLGVHPQFPAASLSWGLFGTLSNRACLRADAVCVSVCKPVSVSPDSEKEGSPEKDVCQFFSLFHVKESNPCIFGILECPQMCRTFGELKIYTSLLCSNTSAPANYFTSWSAGDYLKFRVNLGP